MSKMRFSQICLRLFPTLAHFVATASLGLGTMQAWDLASQLDQQISLNFGVRGDAHPHQSYLVPTANAREMHWHRQTWELDEGENAARGAGVKIKFPVLELFAAAFPMFQEQLCWDLSPYLGFNSWPDSTSFPCYQLMLLS